MARKVDRAALFEAMPSRYLVVGPDLVIVDVNRAYLRGAREDLIGQPVIQAFPYNLAAPDSELVRDLRASLHRVLATGEPETMALQRYEIPVRGEPGGVRERWYSPVHIPVPGPDGPVGWIIQRLKDVTDYVGGYRSTRPKARTGDRMAATQVLEAEHARAQELQRLNEELRQAHARERRTAATLQEAMLQTPDLEHHPSVTVRYLPAVEGLNVGGDWYDVVDIPPTSSPSRSAMSSGTAWRRPR